MSDEIPIGPGNPWGTYGPRTSRSLAQVTGSANLVYCTVRQIDHISTGAFYKRARMKAGLSLREVARRLRLSAAFVSDLERGRRNWTDKIADQYQQLLDSLNEKGQP